MHTSDAIIEIRDLTFGYDAGNPVLDSINLTVKRGQSGCIVGPNGGGKSTLLRLLLGLLTPDRGTIRIFGESLAPRSCAALSGGQRQRVLIARALACEPQLLLLDEPTANIDPGAEEQFYATLNILRRRMTVLTVSHDLGFVNREIDLVICVNRQLTVHQAGAFNAETANAVYHHEVNLIQHDHSCFCSCKHPEECGEGRK